MITQKASQWKGDKTIAIQAGKPAKKTKSAL
jgi:hypothetical protein